jgi:hypothetical protein
MFGQRAKAQEARQCQLVRCLAWVAFLGESESSHPWGRAEIPSRQPRA